MLAGYLNCQAPAGAWQSRVHQKRTLCRIPVVVRPYELTRSVRARASRAMSSSQGPDKRPRWVPPIM